MRGVTLFLLLFCHTLVADDSDMDGVDDAWDLCSDTEFFTLVDSQGCSIATLEVSHSMILLKTAFSYYEIDSYFQEKTPNRVTSFSLFMQQNGFGMWLESGYYETPYASGMEDTVVGIKRDFLRGNTVLSPSLALLVPTYKSGYDNEALDVALACGAAYRNLDYELYAELSYTFINDRDIDDTRFENSAGVLLGVGDTFAYGDALSLEYLQESASIKNLEPLEKISLHTMWSFDPKRSVGLSYGYGLSQSSAQNSFTFVFNLQL